MDGVMNMSPSMLRGSELAGRMCGERNAPGWIVAPELQFGSVLCGKEGEGALLHETIIRIGFDSGVGESKEQRDRESDGGGGRARWGERRLSSVVR